MKTNNIVTFQTIHYALAIPLIQFIGQATNEQMRKIVLVILKSERISQLCLCVRNVTSQSYAKAIQRQPELANFPLESVMPVAEAYYDVVRTLFSTFLNDLPQEDAFGILGGFMCRLYYVVLALVNSDVALDLCWVINRTNILYENYEHCFREFDRNNRVPFVAYACKTLDRLYAILAMYVHDVRSKNADATSTEQH